MAKSGQMGRKNKLGRFSDLMSYPNVYENFDTHNPHLIGQNNEPVELKGEWAKKHFGNTHPITLELACGRGEYTVALAKRYPERNFIGVDIKGARIWKGATYALEENLKNVAFLRTRIEFIEKFFASGEISNMWITFPDPFPRKSKANRRLTGDMFLEKYKAFLPIGGRIHLKTDADTLYEFTLEVLGSRSDYKSVTDSSDIYAGDLPHPDLDIQTYYEGRHLEAGKKIKYVQIERIN